MPTPTDPQATPTTQQAHDANRANRATIKTAAGEVAIIPSPVVLDNGRRPVDPTNPAGATRIRPPKARDPKVDQYRQELHHLLALDQEHPEFDSDRLHALHYLASGLPVPGAAEHPGVDPEDADDTPAAE